MHDGHTSLTLSAGFKLNCMWMQQEETAVAERKEHANQLREQIAAHEVERRRLAGIKLAEGNALRKSQAKEKSMVEVRLVSYYAYRRLLAFSASCALLADWQTLTLVCS